MSATYWNRPRRGCRSVLLPPRIVRSSSTAARWRFWRRVTERVGPSLALCRCFAPGGGSSPSSSRAPLFSDNVNMPGHLSRPPRVRQPRVRALLGPSGAAFAVITAASDDALLDPRSAGPPPSSPAPGRRDDASFVPRDRLLPSPHRAARAPGRRPLRRPRIPAARWRSSTSCPTIFSPRFCGRLGRPRPRLLPLVPIPSLSARPSSCSFLPAPLRAWSLLCPFSARRDPRPLAVLSPLRSSIIEPCRPSVELFPRRIRIRNRDRPLADRARGDLFCLLFRAANDPRAPQVACLARARATLFSIPTFGSSVVGRLLCAPHPARESLLLVVSICVRLGSSGSTLTDTLESRRALWSRVHRSITDRAVLVRFGPSVG